jgi:L-fuconolactonase
VRIIDAQIHVWGPGMEQHAARLLHTWRGPDAILEAMDRVGVSRAVIVPPGSGANDFSVDIALRHPDRFGVMTIAPLDKEEGHRQVAEWAQRPPAVLGFRIPLAPWRKTSWLEDGTADWFWPAAAQQRIPVMIWAPGQWPAVHKIARENPALPLIVDHLGLYVDVKDETVGRSIAPILALSELSNVGVKLSALPCHSTEPYPYRNLHPHIRSLFESFGPRRLFWGSDMTRLPCPYEQAVTMFLDQIEFLSTDDLDWIMGRALSEWLRWS